MLRIINPRVILPSLINDNEKATKAIIQKIIEALNVKTKWNDNLP